MIHTIVFPLNEAYAFAIANGLEQEINAIRMMNFDPPWDKRQKTIRRAYVIDLFEKKGIFQTFCDQYWKPDNLEKWREKYQYYQRLKCKYEESPEQSEVQEADGDEEDVAGQRFATEDHLRDTLAKNLDRIEPGLTLYQKGCEFEIDNGRIDILALDRNKRFLVVELKLSRGIDKAIGQLLHYMGWVDTKLGSGPCRGMIIAGEITDKLALAARRVPDVTLCRYHLSVTVEPISNN